MSQGVPFDPSRAIPGTVLQGIDPASLQSGRSSLKRWRLEFQYRLREQEISRHTMITVSTDGIVYDGNHAAVDILITDEPTTSFGSFTDVPIEE